MRIALNCLFPIALLASGCATLIQGTSQQIPVTSTPAGAEVTVNGRPIGQTPLVLDLKRKQPATITLKVEGFNPYTTVFERKRTGWFWLIPTVYGIPLLFWDMATGAAYVLKPKEINFNFAEGLTESEVRAKAEAEAKAEEARKTRIAEARATLEAKAEEERRERIEEERRRQIADAAAKRSQRALRTSSKSGSAGRGFTYSNVTLAETSNLLTGAAGKGYIGEMTNNTGEDYAFANFKVSMYGRDNALFGVVTLVITDFRNGETKSFVTIPLPGSEDLSREAIASYKIAYDSGFLDD